MTSRLTPSQKNLLKKSKFSNNTIDVLNNPNINIDQRFINEILKNSRIYGSKNFRSLHPHFEKLHYHITIKEPTGRSLELTRIFIGSDKINDIKLAVIGKYINNKRSTNKNLNLDDFDLFLPVSGGTTLIKLNDNNTLLEENIPQYDKSGYPNSSLHVILRSK